MLLFGENEAWHRRRGLCRDTFPDLERNLHFFVVRGFDWKPVDSQFIETSPCQVKFSCHLIVKHETHMFSCLADLNAFLELLKKHEKWRLCGDIVDPSVYNATQLFRTPFAVKSPDYLPDTRSFDLDTSKNVLLPVDPASGDLNIPQFPHSRVKVQLHLSLWKNYLLTVPVRDSELATALESMIPSYRSNPDHDMFVFLCRSG
jgi:hypothetical protein